MERSRIRAVQMDNLRGFLGIRRMDIVPNALIRELCGVTKGVNERIDEGVLRWFGHVKRINKRVYVGECASSRSLGRPRKRWIYTVEDCLRKRELDVESLCWGMHGASPGDEPLTLTRCHRCGLS